MYECNGVLLHGKSRYSAAVSPAYRPENLLQVLGDVILDDVKNPEDADP